MSVHEHKKEAPTSVDVFILTVSDTRTPATDTSGQLMAQLLSDAGHRIVGHEIVKDERVLIREVITREIAREETQAILLTGGTGVGSRDVTVEVVQALLDKELPGYGELFRLFSYEEIGAAAMLSRAIAGVAGKTVLFASPGSSAAVCLAMNKLILPELGHLIRETLR